MAYLIFTPIIGAQPTLQLTFANTTSGLLLIGETFSDLLIAHLSLTTSLLAKTLSDWSTAHPSLTTLSFAKMHSDLLIHI